jgi:hypothetical protein
MIRCLASLRRVRLGAVPRVQRYYQDTMTSCRSSRVTSLPSLGDTTVCTRAFAPAWQVPPRKPGVGNPVSPSGMFPWKRQDLPSSRATPIIRLHMLFDSGKTVAPDRLTLKASVFRATTWPPLRERQRLSHGRLTKLNHMAFGLAIYASWSRLPNTTQDSLPAVGQTLPDGLLTRRVTIEGFQFTSCQSSSLAKLLGAIPFTFPFTRPPSPIHATLASSPPSGPGVHGY